MNNCRFRFRNPDFLYLFLVLSWRCRPHPPYLFLVLSWTRTNKSSRLMICPMNDDWWLIIYNNSNNWGYKEHVCQPGGRRQRIRRLLWWRTMRKVCVWAAPVVTAIHEESKHNRLYEEEDIDHKHVNRFDNFRTATNAAAPRHYFMITRCGNLDVSCGDITRY